MKKFLKFYKKQSQEVYCKKKKKKMISYPLGLSTLDTVSQILFCLQCKPKSKKYLFFSLLNSGGSEKR